MFSSTHIPGRGAARAVIAGFGLLLLAAACSDDDGTEAAGESGGEARPFDGETIELVVGYDPGGSFDDAARWLQPYLEEQTGATVVVENRPGAGNLIALNYVWASEPDGSVIGTLNGPGNTVTVLAETASDSVEFELPRFSYLAGLTSEPRLMTVGADSPYETFEDLLAADEEILLGVTGTSGSGYNDAVFMQSVFGDQIETEIVSGFESGAENQLALIRGEVDASFNLLGGELAAIEAGEIRGLVVLGNERSPLLPDVPAIVEYDLPADVMEMLDIHITISQLGVALVAPPDLPDDLLGPLSDAVFEAASDPALVEEATSRGVNWAPRTGAELKSAVEDALDAPAEYVELMREAATS
ncbi:Bug family tripartite tricarboxylate transporter substrate binding protein [Jiangella asiatica]|uniref:Tripartite tricarboxylate transporter substrate binding protein n=1 Tax=Jiangella asiatica TaxID=2530372 RepID=A0A4R5CL96_9ACTN|nr:tripartite tricarboxylate transporter substrate binding protein [Jiangella asiatica]TDE00686.1 tripartite tricarboxylate transporter substrate binding protein [Jiangella asiatica]